MKDNHNAAKRPVSGQQEVGESDGGKMKLTDHLKELRNRLAVCLVFFVIAFVIVLTYSQNIIDFLTDMGTAYDYVFVYIAPQELLMQQFTVTAVVSLCATVPLLLYQIWAFVKPALKEGQSKLVIGVMISGLICFVIGILFAYKIMIPFMLRFLIGISADTAIQASISIAKYLSFVITIFVIMGVIFELPVISVLLTQLGVVKVEWMKKAFRPAIVVIFVIAALVTPPDVISQCMVAIPMIVLYTISIYLSSFLLRFKKSGPEEDVALEEDDD